MLLEHLETFAQGPSRSLGSDNNLMTTFQNAHNVYIVFFFSFDLANNLMRPVLKTYLLNEVILENNLKATLSKYLIFYTYV